MGRHAHSWDASGVSAPRPPGGSCQWPARRIPSSNGTEIVVTDRWLNAPTVDFAVTPPVRVRRLQRGEQPPNLPVWPTNCGRNVRPDMPCDPRRRVGWWLW